MKGKVFLKFGFFIIANTLAIVYNIMNHQSLFLVIALFTVFLGGIFNFLVISLNNYKMPVFNHLLKEKEINTSPIHKKINDKENCKLFFFCDRFILILPRKVDNIINTFSLGDVMIVLGTIISLILLIVL
ncbi:MAG: DUF5317 family protein [Nanoarchaeota archaeon]